MAYTPKQMTDRICTHCGTSYQARDKRRIYCSSSCNTLAWMARQEKKPTDLPKTDKAQPDGSLALTTQNVATIAVGAAATAGINYLLNDRPAQQEVKQMLQQVIDGQKRIEVRVANVANVQADHIIAQMGSDPLLRQRMDQAFNRRIEMAKQQKKGLIDSGPLALRKEPKG